MFGRQKGRAVVHLTNATIDQLIRNRDVAPKFPFLAEPPTKPCDCPKNPSGTKRSYELIRSELATMPRGRFSEIADALGADRIEFVYDGPGGHPESVTWDR